MDSNNKSGTSYLEVPDFNMLFHSYSSRPPILINNVPYTSKEERKAFNSLILTTYETDVLSNIPSCACGKLEYGYNLGKTCKVCDTTVVYPSESDIDFRVWIKVPDGIKGFIIPIVWAQLTKLLNTVGYNILEWLTNVRSNPGPGVSKTTLKRIQYFESINWPRGLNNFIDNFDRFIDLIPHLTKDKGTAYAEYLKTIKHRIFPQYMPMPTKAMLILINNVSGRSQAEPAITGAIDAARTIADISQPRIKPLSKNQLEAKIVSVINNLVDYYTNTIKNDLCSKNGWIRRQQFCSRSHFCARGVITSINVPHNRRELWMPWAQGLEILKIHIISKLLRRGYGFLPAYNLVESSGNIYVPLLDEIINELIREAPGIGIPHCFQRNPSLHRLSAQTFYITRVKTDLSDKTFSMSVLCTKGPNADKFNVV